LTGEIALFRPGRRGIDLVEDMLKGEPIAATAPIICVKIAEIFMGEIYHKGEKLILFNVCVYSSANWPPRAKRPKGWVGFDVAPEIWSS
jgi:hypothetical protein